MPVGKSIVSIKKSDTVEMKENVPASRPSGIRLMLTKQRNSHCNPGVNRH